MTRLSFLTRLPLLLLLGHLYVAARLSAAASGTSLQWFAIAAVAMLYLLILAGFLMRGHAGERLGDAAAWTGFLALGCFSWLFVLTFLRDVVLLALELAAVAAPGALGALARHAHAPTAAAVPLLALAAVLWGLFNARRAPRIVDVAVAFDGLPKALHGLSVVQITDLHVGPTIKAGYVRRVVDAANRLRPDIIALTGDLVDGNVDRLGRHVRPLADLRARLGVYAVTGNHEYYAGVRQWLPEFRRLGLRMLMNEHDVIGRGEAAIVIAGVTDFSAGRFDAGQASDPVRAMRGAPMDAAVRILLAHQPRSAADAASAGFDLQLSGHTHGGQFWPWHYFVPLQQPFVAGLHRVGALRVYVSRGTGYWGPPLRLGARSEITRIRLAGAPARDARRSPGAGPSPAPGP